MISHETDSFGYFFLLTFMAPTAIYSPPVPSAPSDVSNVPPKNPALVIGSLSTAQSGRYQSVLESLNHRDVERQLVDRITDGGRYI